MSAKFVARIGAAVAVALIAVGSIGLAGQMAGAAPAKGSIAGTVRDAVTGEPVSGVSVDVFYLATNGAPGGGTVQGPGFLAGTQTAADGTYKVSGLAPSDANGYWVCFDTGLFGPYEFECWVDQSTFFYPFPDPFGFFQLPSASRTVHLGAGQHVTGIDGDLIAPAAPGSPPTTGSVGGRVTAKGTNSGVSGVDGDRVQFGRFAGRACGDRAARGLRDRQPRAEFVHDLRRRCEREAWGDPRRVPRSLLPVRAVARGHAATHRCNACVSHRWHDDASRECGTAAGFRRLAWSPPRPQLPL